MQKQSGGAGNGSTATNGGAKEVRLWCVVTDHLGTPREMLSEDGSLVWAAEYTTWGSVRRLWQADNDDNPDGNFQGMGPDGNPVYSTRVYGTSGNTALKPAQNPDAYACPIRFQGQWADEETGLYYNRFRYYDPDAAQYMSSDPIGLIGGLRSQGYVEQPSCWVDVLGLANCWVAKHPDIFVSPNGGPIFGDSHLIKQSGILNTVEILITGSRHGDFSNANAAAGLPRSGKPSGYTWHHVDDFNPKTGTSTMQLVKTDVHSATTPHDGSEKQYQDATNTKYETKEAKAASKCCRTLAKIGQNNC